MTPFIGWSFSPASDARRMTFFVLLYQGVLFSSTAALPNEVLRSAKLGDALLEGLSARVLFRLNQPFSFSFSFSLPFACEVRAIGGDPYNVAGERSPDSTVLDN